MAEVEGSDRIVFTTKEILAEINAKLAKQDVLVEQLDKRTERLEHRIETHDRILTDQIPKLTDFMEKMNVQQQVEAALDSRRVHGVSSRDKLLVGGLSACILVVSLLSYLPHALG